MKNPSVIFGSHDSLRAFAGEGRAVMIAVPALRIETAAFRERFEQSGLAAAVFTDEERDLGPEREIYSVREGANVEGILSSIHQFRQAHDSPKERRAESVG
jgi:hypothetical protein